MTSQPELLLPAAVRPRDSSRAQGLNDDTGWLITLSDLTLLLLCFLGLWYVKHHQKTEVLQPAKPAAQADRDESPPRQATPENVHASDWSSLRDEIESFIADAGMSGEVNIEATPHEILVSFKDSIPFASGKADIKPGALPVLEKVAAVAVSRPAMHLAVSGHTDDRPISSLEFPSNWELSSARASRVARYLIEKGVHPSRIEVQGFSSHRPRVPNGSFTGRRANRRVEIHLLRSSDAIAPQSPELSSH
jgi:chemotaxis protein MotB